MDPRQEIRKGRRKWSNEGFPNLYCSPNLIRVAKSRRLRRAGRVACMGVMRNTNRILVGKLEGKRPLRRPVRR
jgi:hypothetical protein